MILDNKAFDIFNNTTAVILERDGYDDYDEDTADTFKEKGSVTGDMQPYSGEKLHRDYGLQLECTNRFYCNVNENITEGAYLKTDTAVYEVIYIKKWGARYEIMLREVDLNA